MKVLVEGAYYPITTLQSIFDDPKFYIQKGAEGKIISVGYYHSFKKQNLVYMLPKVFLVDEVNSVFGKTKDELLELDTIKNVKHDPHFNWIRLSLVYFYNSLLEYRKRIADSQIVNQTERFELNTNLGDQEYSYLDLLLSFVNFYKKNKNQILYRHIEYKSSQVKKTKWEKTIRKTLPLLTVNHSPVYAELRNKKKVVNNEEELLTYFFSILEHFNKDHNLSLKINKSYKILKGSSFKSLQSTGLSKLRKIKHRYFNDSLKRMYALCEIYFSQTDTSSAKRKREDFLSVNNYNLVFEDMIDKLFSDELNNTEVDGVSLKDLKKNDDGKIIDHIYDYQSLIDTSNIFYIGDSKYYKPNSDAGKISKYKQFTYAKNIIQFNIDLLNKDKAKSDEIGIRYRDELTEGYNITPNFFIYGYIKNEENFDDSLIEKKGAKPINSFHFEDRLFDRDTLFVHQYEINFLFVLKAYTSFNSAKTQNFRKKVKEDFRQHFIEFFSNSEKSLFEFYEYDGTDFKDFIKNNFRLINGKTFVTNEGKLILAKHNSDETLSSILSDFIPYNFEQTVKTIKPYNKGNTQISIAAEPKTGYGEQQSLNLDD